MEGEKKTTYFGDRLIRSEKKKELVQEVFTSVAGRYDLMNDLMSFGTHRLWKRYVVEKTGLRPGEAAIDVAGGTADIAMLMAKRVGDKGRVVVYDINRDMIEIGRDKCMDGGVVGNIRFVQGNAEEIACKDNTFHCATIGFGIRNVTNIGMALKEMRRVIKPGGRVICLEFSHPRSGLLSKLYNIYSFKIIPNIGEIITGDRGAYTYLPESIRKFPPQETLKKMMEETGLFKVRYYNLFDGIAAVHIGFKV